MQRLNEVDPVLVLREYQACCTYWLAALHVACAGFHDLGQSDPEIDDLIATHRGSLRLHRNAAFHFQRRVEKILQFHADGGARLTWADALHDAFAAWFEKRCAGRPRLTPC